MRVAQSGSDFGGDLVERLSDDLALGVGFCGFYDLGHCAVLLWMWRYLSAATDRPRRRSTGSRPHLITQQLHCADVPR